MQQRPVLLWVRVLNARESAATRALADEYFRTEVCPNFVSARAWTKRVAPQVVCWEYEEMDASALRAMRDFKLANPALPVLMITAQHSEALAVWAFRARVWNYLVKPVAVSELRANFSLLSDLVREERGIGRSVRQLRAFLPRDAQPPESQSSLLAAVGEVERHYAEKLRQSAVAAKCGMSTSTFSRAFKAEYGMTFSAYLMRFRIAQACHLLRLGSHTATTAGLAVGFDDASHFARAFRKLMGIPPSAFKRQRMPGRQRDTAFRQSPTRARTSPARRKSSAAADLLSGPLPEPTSINPELPERTSGG
jgi:AraC-like DNA-binding protein/ActR/RegA family two-component response regulator